MAGLGNAQAQVTNHGRWLSGNFGTLISTKAKSEYLMARKNLVHAQHAQATANLADEESEATQKSERAGGLAALSGFFFQFLATLAHVGEFRLRDPTSDVPQSEAETFFSVEVGDSDYQRTHGREVHIVQFKHSSAPDNHKIYVEGLYEITKALVLAKQAIERESPNARVHCILATNRPLDDRAQEAMKVAKAGKANDDLKKYRGFKGYALEVEYRFEKEESWFETVEEWGKSLGMTPREVEKGIEDIAALFMKRTLQGRRTFGIDAVHEAFVGFEFPRDMKKMHEKARQETQSFFNRLDVPDTTTGGAVAQRSALLDQLQTAIRSHALVVLAGQGGNGKSTLLAAALRDQLDNCFVLGSKVSAVEDNWIPNSVSLWRNAPSGFDATQTLDCALTRLQNWGDQQPILVAALDALDEVELDKPRVERLIRQFEEIERGPKPPTATLLLTCRSKDELNRLFGEPGHDHLQSASGLNIGAHIDVRLFDDGEIFSALSTNKMSNAVRSRLRLEFGGSVGIDVQPLRPRSLLPIDPDLKEALYHPMVWGHLFDGDFQPDEQEALLNGDGQLLGELASKVVGWFAAKCQARTQERVPSDHATRILYLVAKHCSSKNPPFDYEDDWETPLQNRSIYLSYAPSVVKQAISAGLVEAEFSPFNFSWRWRHPFLMQHLVNKYKSMRIS